MRGHIGALALPLFLKEAATAALASAPIF